MGYQSMKIIGKIRQRACILMLEIIELTELKNIATAFTSNLVLYLLQGSHNYSLSHVAIEMG